jgi:hypothetical protein
MRKRSVWVEPLFAEGKDWHGMRRFRLRCLWRVNCEALMRATGQNLKRLLKKRGWGSRSWPDGAAQAAYSLHFGFFLLLCKPLEASFRAGSRSGGEKMLARAYLLSNKLFSLLFQHAGRSNGNPCSPRLWMILRTVAASCICAYLPLLSIWSLCFFALCAVFRRSLMGRYSHDYYKHSVSLEVALRRKSRGTSVRYVLARLRVPTHLLNGPHWTSFIRRECIGLQFMPMQRMTSVSGVLPMGAHNTPGQDWGLGSVALPVASEPYKCHALQRLQACTRFPSMLLFRLTFVIG